MVRVGSGLRFPLKTVRITSDALLIFLALIFNIVVRPLRYFIREEVFSLTLFLDLKAGWIPMKFEPTARTIKCAGMIQVLERFKQFSFGSECMYGMLQRERQILRSIYYP